MRAHLRVVLTAVALAAVATLGLAYGAHAVPAPTGGGNTHQRATTDRPAKVWRCNAGHGPQFDCQDPVPLRSRLPNRYLGALAPVDRGRLDLVRSLSLLGLLVALAAAGTWLWQRH